MSKTHFILLVALLAAIAGIQLGQANQEAVTAGQDWQLVSTSVAGYAGGGQAFASGGWVKGDMYLYNRRTGKVYRYYSRCTAGGVEVDSGCFGDLPVLDSGQPFRAVPSPQSSDEGSGR